MATELSQIKDPSDVVALVVDNGLFVEIAIKLAKTFKKVYYYVPWESAFAKMNLGMIGTGLEGIEVVDSIYGPHFDDVDLFVFPDIYFGHEQEMLEKMGKAVWGSRTGECLELKREGMKEIIKALDMPVGKFTHIKGMANLRAFLKENEDVYVKIDKYRGTFETFHSANYKEVEPKLDEVEFNLGAFKNTIEFTVEASLPDCAEVGTDCWVITDDNGEAHYPQHTISGIEIKDVGFASIFKKYEDIPEVVTRFNTRMKPVFAAYNWRGFMSTEVRIGKDMKPYMIDLCARAPSPPNELYQEQYSNLADCIWAGANGIVIEPEATAKYGAEIMLHSSWADKGWQPVSFPEELRDRVKLRNATCIDGIYYAIPQACGLPEVGAVIGLGDTLQEALDDAVENAEQVTGYYLEAKMSAIDSIKEECERLEKLGLNMFDEVE
jgi:predicted RNase H-like HicB family nuclease